MSKIVEFDPNRVFKNPDLKSLLAERVELVDQRKKTNNIFEKLRLSSKISQLDV